MRYIVITDRRTDPWTYTVQVEGTGENISHHEKASQANAAIARYIAADKRRARQTEGQA